MQKASIKLGDVIYIGKTRAVISSIYNDEMTEIEVVYLDGTKAINEDVLWNGTSWEFKYQGVCGGYADKYDRLTPYVRILRNS